MSVPWLLAEAPEYEEMSSMEQHSYEASLRHALREEYKKGTFYLKTAVLPALVVAVIGIQWAVKRAPPFKHSRVVLILFAVATLLLLAYGSYKFFGNYRKLVSVANEIGVEVPKTHTT